MLERVGVSGSSESEVRFVYRRLVKLRGLSDLQFAVMCKYPCVLCEHFGFNYFCHFWLCELGCFWEGQALFYVKGGESCEFFVRNVKLRGGLDG